MENNILNFFEYGDLSEEYQKTGALFYSMASILFQSLPHNVEQALALNILLQARSYAFQSIRRGEDSDA